MIQQARSIKPVLPYLVFYLFVNIFSWKLPFFWDAILNSKIAHWYLQTGFSSVIIPTGLDAGHPPFFSLYIALVWKIFGKSLLVSHLAVLPFSLGIIWQSFLLLQRFFKNAEIHWVLVLLCLEPTLLAQSTMVSAELPLVFFYLLALNSVFNNRRFLLFLALAGMASVNLRGVIATGAVFITEMFVLFFAERSREINLKKLLPYLFAWLFIISWLIFHFTETGWLISTPSENWAGQRKPVSFIQIIKNLLITGWRIIDFGRIGLWIAAAFAVLINIFNRNSKALIADKKFRLLLSISAVPLIVFVVSMLPFSNPIGHRYFLAFYVLFTFFAAYVILKTFEGIKRWLVVAFVCLILISGHFWVYPDKIAQGWDSSLAHLPYFDLREKMIDHIQENNINPIKIGTSFPNVDGTGFTDLDNSVWKFAQKDFSKNRYVFQSNVFNDFTDNELETLKRDWKLEKEFSKNRVYVKLYRRR